MTRTLMLLLVAAVVALAGCRGDTPKGEAPATHDGSAHDHGDHDHGDHDHGDKDHGDHDHGDHDHDDHGSHDHGDHRHEPATKPSGFSGNSTCPVSDDPVDPELFVQVGDLKVYVCCDDCVDDVKAAPDKYAAAAYPK